MIIKEMVLHNFGVYAHTNRFEFAGKKPIVLIGGMNGRGKTTFLESILLALYGSNSFAYQESQYRTYGQYLKAYVNATDETYYTFVDLVFQLSEDVSDTYKVHREWYGNKQRVSETIYVYRNGEFNQFLTENWPMFIENILPSGLSSFFFFDGEKIAELAVEETNKQMKESIKTLLGINMLDTLENDLERVIRKSNKQNTETADDRKLSFLRANRDEIIQRISSIDSEIDTITEKKKKKQQKLEKLLQEYTAKGGDVISQKHDLIQKKITLQTQRDTIKEELLALSASALPLLLVKGNLAMIKESAEFAIEKRIEKLTLERFRDITTKYTQQNKRDREAINRLLSYAEQESSDNVDEDIYDFDEKTVIKLSYLLEGQLPNEYASMKNALSSLKNITEQLDRIESYLSVDIDEKAVAQIYKQIKEIERELIDLDIDLNKLTDSRREENSELMVLTSHYNKLLTMYLSQAEGKDDAERIIKYSHMAIEVIGEYRKRLQERKINTVADTMTKCYKELANKRNLIDTITMDPETLDMTYLDATGSVVNKSSLSAGEKQLMVVSLLWALALCSKKKLPVIIDTPLSRLDSAHRRAFIKTYFPRASEQTIILSTDSEIDEHYYNMIKENVGDEYTLVYDDSSKSTTVRKGYFTEVE